MDHLGIGYSARSCPSLPERRSLYRTFRHCSVHKRAFIPCAAGRVSRVIEIAVPVDTQFLCFHRRQFQCGDDPKIYREAVRHLMLIYEYKIDGTKAQYQAIDEAIRVVQFIRNKCLRLWMDERGINKNDLQCYCAELAREYSFANTLNSQARQASADRAWFAISRFYDNCKAHKPGKKGYPKFQHNNRSVDYKQTGWKLSPDGRHISFTDGCGIGQLRLVGNSGQHIETFPTKQIKRVRLVKRADGYYCQFSVQAERKVEHLP